MARSESNNLSRRDKEAVLASAKQAVADQLAFQAEQKRKADARREAYIRENRLAHLEAIRAEERILPSQSRAARALLDWPQQRLADEANVGISTVRDFEKGRNLPHMSNALAIRKALEDAGVEFIWPEDWATSNLDSIDWQRNYPGAGVRWSSRWNRHEADHYEVRATKPKRDRT